MTAPSLDAVIFDLDGVIRHYDRVHERDIEARFGLERGSLLPLAFGGELGHRFMCGEIDHDEFAESLSVHVGRPAAEEFVSMRAVVDPEAVDLVMYLQARMPIALLTNGSTRTRQELEEAGLSSAFHHVFNSAETGVPKPHPDAYLGVLNVLDVEPSRAAFIDDHEANIEGASAVGLIGHHYQDLIELRSFLAGHGVLPRRGDRGTITSCC